MPLVPVRVQTPLTAKQPEAREMPFAKVEVAEPVRLSEAAWRPLVKVEVPAPVTPKVPVKVPPVTARPLDEESPPAERPPVKVEVAVP